MTQAPNKLRNKTLMELDTLVDGDGAYIYAVKDGVDYNMLLGNLSGVTSITAGTGLSGGTISSVGTIALSPTSVASLAKADTAVQPASLATVATSGSYNDLSNRPTIPAAQVNSDWNATSGVAQILNKPSLATVAVSGNYNDLTNRPSIPAAQVNADWNATSGITQILNKPALNFEPVFAKGSIIAGNNVTISGNLANRLVGAGDITINAIQPPAEGGGVSAVTAVSPLASSGGATPQISIQAATGSQNGYMSSTDKAKLDSIAAGATANTGTVTSVAASVPTGFTVSGSPITGSGTLAIAYASGYQGYTTGEANKLNGIAAGATANTGTVTSVNVSVPTGLSVSGGPISTSGTIGIGWASGYRAYTDSEASKLSGIAAGATANSGTVTSVALSGGSGISISGGPITSNGSITVAVNGQLPSWAGIAPASKQDTIAGNGITKVTCSNAAPGTLQAGELYLRY